MNEPRYREAFRDEIFQKLVPVLISHCSCALVGVGSSGKSNIARLLSDPKRHDVRLRYFGANAGCVLPVYLDCTVFGTDAPDRHKLYVSALYKIDDFIKKETPTNIFTELLPQINALWEESKRNPESLALENLDAALDLVVRAGAKHVILILDDCDDLFANSPSILFPELRHLRDNHKEQVVYLTLTRREPAFLRTNTSKYEKILLLISGEGQTIPVPPYLRDDGEFMARWLAAQKVPTRQLSEAAVKAIFNLSGGHAGLIRFILAAALNEADLFVADAPSRFAQQPAVNDECVKIMASVEEDERNGLRGIARQVQPPLDIIHRLQRRGLIYHQPQRPPRIFSPVFEQYLLTIKDVKESIPADEIPTEQAKSSRAIEFLGIGLHVRAKGQLILNLSNIEYAILHCLADRSPKRCLLGELIEIMTRAEQESGVREAHGKPLERFEHYVMKLKGKLGAASDLIRLEGDGYRLAD